MTSPGTKAQVTFDTDKKFVVSSFYLPDGKTWATSSESSYTFIDGAVIEYDEQRGVWKDESTTWYWPRTGNLSFFAWTDYTDNPTVNGTEVKFLKDDGIVIDDYDVTQNRNKVLLVADKVLDANATSMMNGVPTIFRHILCSFSFNVMLSEGVGTQDIRLHKIEFTELANLARYDEDLAVNWDRDEGRMDFTMFSSEAGVLVEEAGKNLDALRAGTDYYVLIPQLINALGANPEIRVTYAVDSGAGYWNQVTKTATLYNVFKRASFENAKKYVLTISIGQDEVFWAPGVKEWEAKEQTWYPVAD